MTNQQPRTAAGRDLLALMEADAARPYAAGLMRPRILAIEAEAAARSEPDDLATKAQDARYSDEWIGAAFRAGPRTSPDCPICQAFLNPNRHYHGEAEAAGQPAAAQRPPMPPLCFCGRQIVSMAGALSYCAGCNAAICSCIAAPPHTAGEADLPPLDVERLAEAGANVLDGRRIGSVRLYRNTITPGDWQAIAAEYARLAASPDRRQP